MNTFRESWLWANVQHKKNNNLLEAQNLKVECKYFFKKAECFTRLFFFYLKL